MSRQSRMSRLTFGAEWPAVNGVLALSELFAIYLTDSEYPTRRYLKGFSDVMDVPQVMKEMLPGFSAAAMGTSRKLFC